MLRNLGVPLGHTLVAFSSLLKGLNKLILNPGKIENDLENNWAVISEAIQTILRREGYPKPYEILLKLTRSNEKISREVIMDFIDSLEISDAVKEELKAFTPFNFTGY